MTESKVIFADKLSLEEWLAAIEDPNKRDRIADYEFPSNTHLEEYLKTIGKRSIDDVNRLVRHFIFPSGYFGVDPGRLSFLTKQIKEKNINRPFRQSEIRLLLWAKSKGRILPWEGITWIIDLLPGNPRQAIDVLDAYWVAHCLILPDGRMNGLTEAKTIIRAKYILHGDVENAERVLSTISWRELEVLCASLYKEMACSTELTAPANDGGRDVIAVRNKLGVREVNYIQCKHSKKPIGPEDVRALYGVVTSENANKGTLVTTSRFTAKAKDFGKRTNLELIDRVGLIQLLNEYLGTDWPLHIDRHVDEARLIKAQQS